MSTSPLKLIITNNYWTFTQKVIVHSQKWSFTHFLRQMSRVAFTRFCRQIHQSARIGVRGGGASQSWQCQDFHGACYSIPSLTAPRRRGQPDPALGLWCNDCYGYLFDIPSPPRQQLADPPLPLHARKNTIWHDIMKALWLFRTKSIYFRKVA